MNNIDESKIYQERTKENKAEKIEGRLGKFRRIMLEYVEGDRNGKELVR